LSFELSSLNTLAAFCN